MSDGIAFKKHEYLKYLSFGTTPAISEQLDRKVLRFGSTKRREVLLVSCPHALIDPAS